MWLVLLAIILLGVLVFINRKREGFNTSQLLTIYNILMDDTTSGDEKIASLSDTSLVINDSALENIIKSPSFSNNEKIIKIHEYFDQLIDKRNNNPKYIDNDENIDYENFFKVLKIVQSVDYDNDTEKILEIKKLGEIDDAFSEILNNPILSDSLKIINTDDTTQPSIQNLINEIIYPV
jgi:hypothetical protein